MVSYDPLLLPSSSASDFFKKYGRRLAFQKSLKWCKRLLIVVLPMVFVLGFSSPTAQTSIVTDILTKMDALETGLDSIQDTTTDDIVGLSEIIRFATEFRLTEGEAMRYAGLIYHGALEHELEPMKIVALIAAESSFDQQSVNKRSGDYGLGQINWKYWGKPNGLTPQDLLDPAINIVMICHILNHYGNDISRYHRGDGIKSKAYLINVKSILSLLRAHERSLQEERS